MTGTGRLFYRPSIGVNVLAAITLLSLDGKVNFVVATAPHIYADWWKQYLVMIQYRVYLSSGINWLWKSIDWCLPFASNHCVWQNTVIIDREVICWTGTPINGVTSSLFRDDSVEEIAPWWISGCAGRYLLTTMLSQMIFVSLSYKWVNFILFSKISVLYFISGEKFNGNSVSIRFLSTIWKTVSKCRS